MRRLLATIMLATALAVAPTRSAALGDPVAIFTIHYAAHDGVDRLAYVVLPSWYGPARHPEIPVVISPHGRGASGRSNAELWGDLPAIGAFAVVSPDGMGRVLPSFSYGYSGQIEDLARMPDIAEHALPWLRLDRRRVYALGSSMGGQETLLLVARHPRLLAGAAALDSVTDLARRYRQLPSLPCNERCLQAWGRPYGVALQASMRREVGGTPEEMPAAYAARSPLAQVRAIADSGVRLQIWWSTWDRIVPDQRHQSYALFREIRRLNPCAPVVAYVGIWTHSKEVRAGSFLPVVLSGFGLVPGDLRRFPPSVRYTEFPACG